MPIYITGAITIRGPVGLVASSDLPGRQGRLVFSSLAVTDQPVPREVLADRLWAGRPPKAWERDLSAVVSKLRALLSRAGLGDAGVIGSDSSSYQLRLPPGEQVDVRDARTAVRSAAATLRAGAADRALATLQPALETTGRPFLPGEDAPWIDAVRAELRRLRVAALETVAGVYVRRGGAAPEAVAALEEVLRLEPFRETAHRLLMQVHLDSGNRAEALQVYERGRRLLADELGVEPAAETERLYVEALRSPGPAGADAAVPEIRYARSGLINVAYQVVGDGPVDFVFVPGWVSNLELAWQEPRMAGFLWRLASQTRLITFDKRGTGLSDPIPLAEPLSLEERMDDVRAVMDASGSERAVIFGFSEGGTLAIRFAASHPERVARLVLWGSWARQGPTDGFPLGWTREQGMRRFVRPLQQRGLVPSRWFAPSMSGDPAFEKWFARYVRQSASPGMAIALLKANAGNDVRDLLGTLRVPTLVLHRTDDVLVEVEQGRYLAAHIPGARMVEFPGADHWPWLGDSEPILAALAALVASV